jgi:hypothetical protein
MTELDYDDEGTLPIGHIFPRMVRERLSLTNALVKNIHAVPLSSILFATTQCI